MASRSTADQRTNRGERDAARRRSVEQFTKDAESFAAGPIMNDEKALDALATLADLAPTDRVIDVACGPGIVATHLAREASEVVGVDATPKMLELAAARAADRGVADRCRFVEGTMDGLDAAEESFDVAVSRYALHHAIDVEAVADELVRVVKPGGRIVAVDFAATDDAEVAAAYDDAERRRDPSHVRNLTPDEIQSLFTSRGCEVVATTSYQLPMWVDRLLDASNGPDHAGFAAAFDRSLDTHGLGVNARRVDGVVRFEYPIVGFGFSRPTAAFRIRDATPADVTAMTTIYNALLASTTTEWTDEPHKVADRLRWQEAQQAAGLPVLVAESGDGEDDSTVIGWASYGPFRDNDRWPGYRFTVEHSIHVDEGWWGRGVGRRLVEALAERATGAGMHVMIAAVDGDNEDSIRFHERLGFDQVGHLREIGTKHDRWLDLVLLQRVLPGSS